MKIDANAVGKVEGYVGKKKILYFAYILLPTRFEFFFITCISATWVGMTKVTDLPIRPARAVLPTRWT